MKKKILGIFIVLVFLVCFFFTGSAVILFMAPGVELFGIRYIPHKQSVFQKSLNIEDFSGESIYIDTYNVPITINYTDYYSSKLYFVQEFVGFTKSGYDKANIEMSLDDEKNIHIETKELVKWMYADSTGEYKLVLDLSKHSALNKNLFINSNSSKVVINGGATYKDVNIVTNGELSVVNGVISSDNFKYHTNKMININNSINAKNYDLKSTGSSINVSKEIDGDLTAKTKGGDIKFISCNNLNAETGGGNISSFNESANYINSSTNIKTSGGDVSLGHISVADNLALCNIKSNSGKIKIVSMFDGVVSSNRGDIEIGEARAIILNTRIGDINVQTIKNEVVVNGRNGNVKLGELGSATNVKVFTTTGEIEVFNAYGMINLESVNSSVMLNNKGSENIKLKSGRTLFADGLKGAVDIYANGDISAQFESVSGPVNIETGTKSNNINIDASKSSYLDVDYSIRSTKGKEAKVYIGNELDRQGNNLSTGIHEGKNLITVKTSYANVVLKLAI